MIINIPNLIAVEFSADGRTVLEIGSHCATIFGKPADVLRGDISTLLGCLQERDALRLRDALPLISAETPYKDVLALSASQIEVELYQHPPDKNQHSTIVGIIRHLPEGAVVSGDNIMLPNSIFQRLTDGVVVLDQYQHIVFINEIFLELLQLNIMPATLVGKAYNDLVEYSDNERLTLDPLPTPLSFNYLKSRKTAPITTTMIHGCVVQVSQFILDSTAASQRHTMIVLRDITEQTTTLQRLERLLDFERLQQYVVMSFLKGEDLDSVVSDVLKTVGERLDVSRAYVFIFQDNAELLDNTHEWCAPGIKPEIDNLQGLPFGELVPSYFPMLIEHNLIAPTHITELPNDIQEILQPQGIQTVLHLPIYVNERLHGFIGLDENRRARQWLPEEISVLRAVSESHGRMLERQRYQQQLVQARDEALLSSSMKTEFMSNISHEIRTPMTGVLGMFELLAETIKDPDQHAFATEGLHSARSLIHVINDLLDFSQMQSGRLTVHQEPTNVLSVTNEVVMTLQPIAKSKDVTLQLEADASIPRELAVDPTRLRQVLMKLVDNAIKFTEQGSVTVRVTKSATANQRARIHFAVADTGIGIPDDKLSFIFEEFTQTDASVTRQHGGTGLGLPIARQLIALMGGTLEVESHLGHGSTFHFTLSLPLLGTSDRADLMTFPHMHVGLLEPDQTARTVMAKRLVPTGVITTLFENIDTVLTSDLAQPLDVLLVRNTAALPNQHEFQTSLEAHLSPAPTVVYLLDAPPDAATAHSWGTYLIRPVKQEDLIDVFANVASLQNSSITNFNNMRHTSMPILVVEDNRMTQNLIQRILQPLQLSISIANDGQHALDMIAKQQYSVILMDMQMPRMDGVETIEHIRAQEENSDHRATILVTTASLSEHDVSQLRHLDIDGFVNKPFSSDALRNAILQALQKQTTP